jgi:uncharacterized OsmC-like protein
MSVAPKQWTVKIISPAAGPLEVLREGLRLPKEIGPGRTTPVDLLLASIGTCFALSCQAALTARALERVAFEVSVTGHKAPEPPSRLAYIGLEVDFDARLPPADARAVTASAEELCTVTNTLMSQLPCAIRVGIPSFP